MEFTGAFYPFYSDKPIEIVVQKMLDFAKSIGYQWEYFNQEEYDHRGYFFWKNKKMLTLHDEKGYNTLINGEGCFCLELKETNLNCGAKYFEFEQEPYDSFYNDFYCVFSKVYYYYLVLPEAIDENDFSLKNKSSKKLVILYLKKRINCHTYPTRTNFVLHLTHTIFLLIIAPLLHVKLTFFK
jgi:hypothetical protein